MSGETFIDEAESIVEEVATRLAAEIEAVVEALAPDGRAFETELKTEDEKLADYRNIRNSVEGWSVWLSNKSLEITQQLQTSGVSQDKIDAINPLSIAIAYARDYSARMEAKLAERMV